MTNEIDDSITWEEIFEILKSADERSRRTPIWARPVDTRDLTEE